MATEVRSSIQVQIPGHGLGIHPFHPWLSFASLWELRDYLDTALASIYFRPLKMRNGPSRTPPESSQMFLSQRVCYRCAHNYKTYKRRDPSSRLPAQSQQLCVTQNPQEGFESLNSFSWSWFWESASLSYSFSLAYKRSWTSLRYSPQLQADHKTNLFRGCVARLDWRRLFRALVADTMALRFQVWNSFTGACWFSLHWYHELDSSPRSVSAPGSVYC